MEAIHFSTEGLRPQDQFEAWRAWFGSAFDVHPADSEAIGFKAEYWAWQIGDLTLPSSVALPTRSVRSMTNLRHHPVDHWAISWGHDGATHYETNRVELLALPRVPFVWSAGRVSAHAHFPAARGTARRRQIYLPRDSFRDIAGKLDAAVGSRLDTPMGALLVGFLYSLEKQLPEVAPVSWTADHLCSRRSTMSKTRGGYRLSSAVRWWSWCERGAHQRAGNGWALPSAQGERIEGPENCIRAR
jgi:hypothetical protein